MGIFKTCLKEHIAYTIKIPSSMSYTFGENNYWARKIMKPYINRNKIIEKEKKLYIKEEILGYIILKQHLIFYF